MLNILKDLGNYNRTLFLWEKTQPEFLNALVHDRFQL